MVQIHLRETDKERQKKGDRRFLLRQEDAMFLKIICEVLSYLGWCLKGKQVSCLKFGGEETFVHKNQRSISALKASGRVEQSSATFKSPKYKKQILNLVPLHVMVD